jgi:signal peptidase II
MTAAAPSRRRLGVAAIAAVIGLDQASKWVMLEHVLNPPRVIEVTPFFNLVYAWNLGVSFGLFDEVGAANRWVLPLVAMAVAAFLAWWLLRSRHWVLSLGLGLIIGGAIGNVIDRIRFGAVFDFLDLHAAGWHWPAFNLADSAITVGVVLLIVDSLFAFSEGRTTERTARGGKEGTTS